MREVEATVIGAGLAPRQQVCAVVVEAMHSGVTVAVGDENVAGCGVYCGICWSVEHVARLPWCCLTCADGHESGAIAGVLVYLVADVVNEPQVVFVVAEDAVRTCEPCVPRLEGVAVGVDGDSHLAIGGIGAPGVDYVAFGVEYEDWDVAAVEYVDAVVGVDGDGSGFSEPDAVWDFGPSGDRFVCCVVGVHVGKWLGMRGARMRL